MKQTSDQYKREVAEPWRGQWLINVYIGLIKEMFQVTAVDEPISDLSFLSTNMDISLFNNITPDASIATFEKNVFRADGGSTFMDENHTMVDASWFGVISDAISDADGNIDFSIGFTSNDGVVGLGGLTLYFMDTYPTSLTITVKADGENVFEKTYENDSMIFVTVDDFSDKGEELILTIHKMNQPYVRFRMYYILFGIGVNFVNQDFLIGGGSYSSFVHSRSIELPTQNFNIEIDNFDDKFDFDKSDSIIHLMRPGQDISLQIGYTKEDGTVEYLSRETMEMDSYSMENGGLKIKAIDFLRNENNTVVFDDPKFFTESTTLYEVAEEVIKHLRSTSFTVILDNALRSVPVQFHQVETTVKEALMMIASAGRCVMEFTPDGVYLRRKEAKYVSISSDSTTSVAWANEQLENTDVVTNFGSFEKNKTRADGTFRFIPAGQSTYKTGYVSEALSKSDGTFDQSVVFDVMSEEGISPSYLTIEFVDTTVRKLTIRTYFDDEPIETLEYDDINSSSFHELHDYTAFNRMTIEVNSIQEDFRRVYAQYVSFNEYVYSIPSDLVLDRYPKGELLDTVRNLYVKYVYSAEDEDGRLDIEDFVIIPCNPTGSDIEYDNPFITNQETAERVGTWLKDYYTNRVQYNFNWMGDPSLEVNDVIAIPNKFNSSGIISDIETNTIIFSNGGIRGRIIARRNVDGMDESQNELDIIGFYKRRGLR